MISIFGLVHVMGAGQRSSKYIKLSFVTTKQDPCPKKLPLRWWFSIVVFGFPYLVTFHDQRVPSGKLTQLWKIAIEIMDFPVKTVIFHSYVSHYQRAFRNDQPTPVVQAVAMAWIMPCPCPSSRLQTSTGA